MGDVVALRRNPVPARLMLCPTGGDAWELWWRHAPPRQRQPAFVGRFIGWTAAAIAADALAKAWGVTWEDAR